MVSCRNTEYIPIEEDDSYRTILIDMLPKLPSMPQFPSLDWSYSNGFYYITESDVDKLIKYKDYDMSLYNLALKKYTSELNIVIDGLK